MPRNNKTPSPSTPSSSSKSPNKSGKSKSKSKTKQRKNKNNKPKQKKSKGGSPGARVRIEDERDLMKDTRVLSILDILLGFAIRILSALFNPIADCDETYNYWEPTSFLLTEYGMQTWEYAPQYSLRSYAYLLPQFFVGKALFVLQMQPKLVFYGIRIFLAMVCLYCEYRFVNSLRTWFGRETPKYCWYFLIFSSGMFNVCAAYLPQQFVLCCVLLSFAYFFEQKHKQAILFMGIAGIIGWPFIALLAIPMAIDCFLKMKPMQVVQTGALYAGILCILSVAVDFFFYRKFLLAAWNIAAYNMHITDTRTNTPQSYYDDDDDDDDQDMYDEDYQFEYEARRDEEQDAVEGQNLYGVEDWIFYCKNLFVNFNGIFILALTAPLVCGWLNDAILYIRGSKYFSDHKRSNYNNINKTRSSKKNAPFWRQIVWSLKSVNTYGLNYKICQCILPFWIWFLFFSYMAHKEERFLFVMYPFIALNASLALTQLRIFALLQISVIDRILSWRIWKYVCFVINFKAMVLVIFILVCASRTFGQCVFYAAPLQIWTEMHDIIVNESGFIDDRQHKKVICVGKEWYRIPTSLLISRVATIAWIDSGFDGQLPAEFASFAKGGTSVAIHPFNDKNEREDSRFVSDSQCDYIIDLWEPNTELDDYPVQEYVSIRKVPFLDREETEGLYRSYYIPYITPQKVKYANYVVLKRKKRT